LKSWLSTIVINVARDLLRRQAVRHRLENLLGWSGLFPQKQEAPEHTYLQQESSSALWQAVNSLDEKHRLPVVLRFVLGMAVGEIAAVLELSEGTIHSRLHYAVRKLQARLGSSLSQGPSDGLGG
jgi:RNA polymerase sigma-70 factor (ECF subfamily)